jgi:hypothetical protein
MQIARNIAFATSFVSQGPHWGTKSSIQHSPNGFN